MSNPILFLFCSLVLLKKRWCTVPQCNLYYKERIASMFPGQIAIYTIEVSTYLMQPCKTSLHCANHGEEATCFYPVLLSGWTKPSSNQPTNQDQNHLFYSCFFDQIKDKSSHKQTIKHFPLKYFKPLISKCLLEYVCVYVCSDYVASNFWLTSVFRDFLTHFL